MRINAGSKLTANDLHEAARVAREHGQDFHIEELAVSPRGAMTFYGESYSGNRRVNRQGRSGAYAAKWQAWGWFIAELYNRDPNARIGQYKSREDFRRQCEVMREARERYGFRTQDDPGRDISFLDHLTEDVERSIAQQQADLNAAKLAEIDEVVTDHTNGDFDADDAIERIARILGDEPTGDDS